MLEFPAEVPLKGEKMQRVLVECKSSSPMLMNPATAAILDDVRSGVRKPKDRDRSAESEAEEKLIRDPATGAYGVPVEYVFACLVEAGRLVKFDGKRMISTKESTLLPSVLQFEGMFYPFTDHSDWVVDKRRGRNPNGGEMVVLIRPRFDRWTFEMTISIDEARFSEKSARELIDLAGRAVGLGDFRPARKGPFGCFTVSRWSPLGEQVAASSNGQREKVQA